MVVVVSRGGVVGECNLIVPALVGLKTNKGGRAGGVLWGRLSLVKQHAPRSCWFLNQHACAL